MLMEVSPKVASIFLLLMREYQEDNINIRIPSGSPKKKESYRNVALFLFALSSDAHAGSHSESGGNGGKDGDYDVQDFAPSVFFHLLKG